MDSIAETNEVWAKAYDELVDKCRKVKSEVSDDQK
jgi:hypothetical protein